MKSSAWFWKENIFNALLGKSCCFFLTHNCWFYVYILNWYSFRHYEGTGQLAIIALTRFNSCVTAYFSECDSFCPPHCRSKGTPAGCLPRLLSPVFFILANSTKRHKSVRGEASRAAKAQQAERSRQSRGGKKRSQGGREKKEAGEAFGGCCSFEKVKLYYVWELY